MPLHAEIGVGIINTDLSQLYKVSAELLKNGTDFLHLDVNDGIFVPTFTFGPPVIQSLRSNLKDAYFEAHMMVADPERWIEPMASAGVDRYAFHIEAIDHKHINRICRRIREAGMTVAIAIKPETDIQALENYVSLADMIMVMFVDIQDHIFQWDVLKKVQWLREHYPNLNIQADGGITASNIDDCAKAGANFVVAGSSIANARSQKTEIRKFRASIEEVFPAPVSSNHGLLSSMNCFQNCSAIDLYSPVKDLAKRYLHTFE